MVELNDLQMSFYRVIKQFIRRQSLVLEALQDFRPFLVMEGILVGTPEERAEIRKEYYRRYQRGYWGKDREWEYFLHGSGCRLTNIKTKEIIEWDVGDLRRFDRFWFTHYLEWLLDSDLLDKDVATIRDFLQKARESWIEFKPSYGPIRDIVFSVLEELQKLGVLSRSEQYFTLIEQLDSPLDS